MLICPECTKPRKNIDEKCASCDFHTEFLDKILVLLSKKDKQKEMFKDYKKIYDEVAVDDLEKSIQHPEYLEIQTNKFFKYLPKHSGLSICELGVGQGRLLKKLISLSLHQN